MRPMPAARSAALVQIMAKKRALNPTNSLGMQRHWLCDGDDEPSTRRPLPLGVVLLN